MANVRRGSPCTSSDDNTTDHPRSKAVVKVTRRKKTKQLKPEAPSTHRMKTRFQTQHAKFRIGALPAEIRNHIYTFATLDKDPLDFAEFSIPPTLSVCRQLRAEALPIFFAANTFSGTVRTNWCIFRTHWHQRGHSYFSSAGILDMAPVLYKRTGRNAPMQVIKEAANFRHVELLVGCGCCSQGHWLAELSLHVSAGKATLETVWLANLPPMDKANIQLVIDCAEAMVGDISNRAGFNGFSALQIRQLAKCFVYKGKGVDALDEKEDADQSA